MDSPAQSNGKALTLIFKPLPNSNRLDLQSLSQTAWVALRGEGIY